MQQRLTLLVTCLTVLMVQLDTTIVSLALHAIQVGLARALRLSDTGREALRSTLGLKLS